MKAPQVCQDDIVLVHIYLGCARLFLQTDDGELFVYMTLHEPLEGRSNTWRQTGYDRVVHARGLQTLAYSELEDGVILTVEPLRFV